MKLQKANSMKKSDQINGKIIGRDYELQLLKKDYQSSRSSLIVGYGRRRIGKSFLFHNHLQSLPHFSFEGIEGQSTKVQIHLFVKALSEKFSIKDKKSSQVKSWEDALDLLTEVIKGQDKKIVIFFDEYQWMASGRSRLTSLLKKYWDNDWRDYSCQLILCGSVSSYMIGKVIRSKALYGRIDKELHIQQLPPREARLFFNKDKSKLEVLKYLMTFGGVPKYLRDIEQNLSYEQNICRFFFDKNSSYIQEFEKIFYSQFKEHKIYEKIVAALIEGPKNLEALSKVVKMKSGGGLKSYLKNLEMAQFIRGYPLVPTNRRVKVTQYRLIDPFLRFYFTFVRNNISLIEASSTAKLAMEKIVKKRLDTFFGYAFENYGLLFAYEIAQKIAIEESIITWGPVQVPGAQIDLLFIRNDKTLNLCEFKFGEQEITAKIIPEIEMKAEKIRSYFSDTSLQKTLICTGKVHKALLASQYFEQILTLQDLV